MSHSFHCRPTTINTINLCNNRLDIVWDVYLENSLNHDIWQSRGTGDRLKVSLSTKIPSHWAVFFKSWLQQGRDVYPPFQGWGCIVVPAGKVVVTTNGSSAVCSGQNHNLKNISPCDHEEAHSRMLLYMCVTHCWMDRTWNSWSVQTIVTFSY